METTFCLASRRPKLPGRCAGVPAQTPASCAAVRRGSTARANRSGIGVPPIVAATPYGSMRPIPLLRPLGPERGLDVSILPFCVRLGGLRTAPTNCCNRITPHKSYFIKHHRPMPASPAICGSPASRASAPPGGSGPCGRPPRQRGAAEGCAEGSPLDSRAKGRSARR